MASKASSEVSPSQSGDGPPAQIPALKGLGTSWYERGTRYWLRRVFTAVVFLAVMALCCFMALAFYDGFRSVLPLAVRIVWDWAQVAASCLAVVWGWLVQRRAHHRQLLEPPTPA